MDSVSSSQADRKAFRAIEIAWTPRTKAEWATFTAARREAGRLWNDLIVRHHRIRRLGWHWPSRARWKIWAKRKYPGLRMQSVQEIIDEFCDAIGAIRQLHRNGHSEARYPWRMAQYRDVVYTNQCAYIRPGRLTVLSLNSGKLRIGLPDSLTLPGRLMQVRLCYGRIILICEVAEPERTPQTVIGVDLGVNTLLAATDGTKAVLISGRGAKAAIQWRHKCLATIKARQSRMQKGSRRWKRLQRRKHRVIDKTKRHIRDMCHKATRMVANAFPDATCYVGEPFNSAGQRTGRVQAQQVSDASTRVLIQQLDYKTAGAVRVNEAYTSQTCPVCGERNKCQRTYRCKRCRTTGPRDAVGALNILSVGRDGGMFPGRAVPKHIKYLRPWRSSSSGRLARSSGQPRISQLTLWEAPSFPLRALLDEGE